MDVGDFIEENAEWILFVIFLVSLSSGTVLAAFGQVIPAVVFFITGLFTGIFSIEEATK